jgi:hypothetical protein
MQTAAVQEVTRRNFRQSHRVTPDTFIPTLRERTLLGILPTGETIPQEAARLRKQEPQEVEFA